MSEFIVSIADAAAAVYFLFAVDDDGCGGVDDPALMLKALCNASDAMPMIGASDAAAAYTDPGPLDQVAV